MQEQQIIYYGIHLFISGEAPAALYIQQEKNELFLSPHGRLCDMGKMAHLESIRLAEEFREAYMPRLIKRYGNDVEVIISEWSSRNTSSGRMSKRIADDSAMAKKRIETGILASNRTP